MSLRVIAGSAGGRRLVAPKGGARPSTDRLKEALFASLGPDRIDDARVLDLYAGSGALAIEALSRGAARAVLVDHAADAATAILTNLERVGFEGIARFQRSTAASFVAGPVPEAPFDLVFLDPPGLVRPRHQRSPRHHRADRPPLRRRYRGRDPQSAEDRLAVHAGGAPGDAGGRDLSPRQRPHRVLQGPPRRIRQGPRRRVD